MAAKSSPGFIHLRVHSAYSLLEGALPVKALAKLAAKDAQPALAVGRQLASSGLVCKHFSTAWLEPGAAAVFTGGSTSTGGALVRWPGVGLLPLDIGSGE